MPISFTLARHAPVDLEALVVGVCADRMDDPERALDWGFLRARGFEGKVGHSQTLPADLSGPTEPGVLAPAGVVVLAVGLGPAAAVDAAVLRRVAATAARTLRRQGVVAVTVLDELPDRLDRGEAAAALVEGLALGSYAFTAYKSQPEPGRLERVVLVGTGGRRVQAAMDRAAASCVGVELARNLVNEPGGALTPRRLAEAAEVVAAEAGLSVEVWDEKAIVRERLGGLVGVNRGSVEPPRLIRLRYEPEGRPRGSVALVGKGITFDSGGLSIKTADGMSTMKDDMGGAAAILGALSAVGVLAPKVRIEAIIPATDNMISGDATRPGDVLRLRNGRTVEVLNTDAEGRLILADALVLACEARPDAVIDVATLTGACEVALGKRIAGLMSNSPGLADQVRAAAERTGEPVWELPLPADYRRQLDSDVADLRNVGTGRLGGALLAGLFLGEFVAPGVPWAHLDIAGPAWSEGPDGVLPKGGTGFGVRLLLDLLTHFRKLG